MLTITWPLAYIICKQRIDDNEKCRRIASDFDCHADCGCGGAMRGTLPDGAHPGHHLKPLDAAIGQVLALHRRGSRHGRQF